MCEEARVQNCKQVVGGKNAVIYSRGPKNRTLPRFHFQLLTGDQCRGDVRTPEIKLQGEHILNG